jgi:hypothetical protein
MIMEAVYAEITLKHDKIISVFDRDHIKEREILQVDVMAKADVSVLTLVIDELTRERLDLRIRGVRTLTFADGSKVDCKVTEPLEVIWKDRWTGCTAAVHPSADGVILGRIPLGGLDLVVDPALGALVGVHGDEQMVRLSSSIVLPKKLG